MGKSCDTGTRILALISAAFLLLAQFIWFFPAESRAETAGDELVVRVQYYGEIGDRIREKARFSRSDLEALGAQTWYYSNITRVGTVMSMAAYGPEVLSIIEASGIDIGSIGNITFRTTDGYTRNFTVERHLTAEKYYYPYLSSCYERNEEGTALTPTEGALEDRQAVPAILALEFGESKRPGVFAEDLEMSTDRTYRFCMGQSDLTEGVMTDPNESGGDISSMDSCHSIYGIDVTLLGSPIRGLELDVDETTVKVGSVKRVSASMVVDETFEGAFTGEDITWTSSDESIASVNADGEVTVLAAGSVTITATAPDGTTASVVLNCVGDETEADSEEEQPENKEEDQPEDTAADTEPEIITNQESAQETASGSISDDELEDTEDSNGDAEDESETEKEKDETESISPGPSAKAEEVERVEPETSEGKDKKDSSEDKKDIEVISGNTLTVHARELVLGDMIVEQASPQDENRDSMAADAVPLDEARTYSRGAAAGTAAGAGLISGAGAIGRVIRYRRDFGR